MPSEPPATAPEARVSASLRGRVADRVDPALPPVIRAGVVEVLSAVLDATTVADRIDGFVAVVDWIRAGDPAVDPFARGPNRLELVMQVIEGDPDLRAAFRRSLESILSEMTGENLFGETGIPHRRGFLGEFFDRVLAYVLPSPRDDQDLSRLLRRLFQREREIEGLRELAPDQFARVATLLFPPDRPSHGASLAEGFADGFRLLAARVLAEGLGEELRARSRYGPVSTSPFLRLSRVSEALVMSWQASGNVSGAAAEWRLVRAACRAQMAEVRRRLEDEGVSIDIVFGLEVIDRCLSRMSLMLEVMEADRAARSAAIHRLLGRLIGAAHADRSVTHLIGWNLRLLGRKIVDRAGETGEHYIAYSREEYRYIWRAAAGGGLLTAATAAIKLSIAGAGLALFQDGLLAGLNYAISFLLLQAFDLMLATKQPAMTGATLAAIFRERRGSERLDEIVDFTARICHSQLAAAVSNVAMVSLGGIAIEVAWRWLFGHPFLDADKALSVQQSFNPLGSGTILYAAITGVILWLASLVGGWFDNWSAVHRLPLAIREHPIGKHIGRERLARLSGIWARNAAGIGTSVSLGLMLGLAPALGHFFGVPLDIRHVTLSAGQLALATASLWPQGIGLWLVYALAGIGCMFVLNLSVSFVLAFLNAARAYGLPASDLVELGRRLAHRIVTRPAEFILPARTPFKLPADHAHA